MSVFTRIFSSSSSPKRPPPPDPTPKWKEEIQNLEASILSLRSTLSVVSPTATAPLSPNAKGRSSSVINNNSSMTSNNNTSLTSPRESNNNNNNLVEENSLEASISKLLLLANNDSQGETETPSSSSSRSDALQPLTLLISKQYEDLKTALLDQIAPHLEQNSKNLKEQSESIALAFADAHELKFVREDLQTAQKKNEGLEHEAATARQTVMELMSKIAKLNPKSGSLSSSSPSKQDQQQLQSTNSSPITTTATIECQVSFPMLMLTMLDGGADGEEINHQLTDVQQLQQKLADSEYLLKEAQQIIHDLKLNEQSGVLLKSAGDSTVSQKLVRTESEVLRWKSLAEEERKTLETIRATHAEAETQLRKRHENEIETLKKESQATLAENRSQWAQQLFDVNRKALIQKEEAARNRILVDESDESRVFLVAEYVVLHVGDARAKFAIAKRECDAALQERNEFETNMKELQLAKDKMEKDLAENTRAMMVLQAGGGGASSINNDSMAKSPSKSKFFGF